MAKIKIASQWLEACAGCHMSFLDIDERVVELLKHVELTSMPITDLKHPPEEGVDVGILTGGIGNEEEITAAAKALAQAENGLDFHRQAHLAYINCAERMMQVGTDGVQILGGAGFLREYSEEMWYRNLRGLAVLEGCFNI